MPINKNWVDWSLVYPSILYAYKSARVCARTNEMKTKKNELGHLDHVDFRFFDLNKIITLLFLRFAIVV